MTKSIMIRLYSVIEKIEKIRLHNKANNNSTLQFSI